AGNEHMVTHGVSLLPLRMQVDGANSFASHLKKVRGQILDAFEHQNYTLGSLVKELNLPRDLSRQPIMSILFNMDSAIGELGFADLLVEQKAIPRNYETFDIFINVKPTIEGIDFEWTYNTDLFKQNTIQRRLLEFKTLLQALLQDTRTSLSRLNILPSTERRLIMEEWTNTQHPYRDDICIHQLIAEQALAHPQAIAVESRGRTLTYAELEEQSNRLAQLLVQRGVRKGDFVSIFMERSVELLVGLLGILKAGGIYIPLDPSNPADRLRVIVEDANSSVLLTQEEMVNELPSQTKTVIVLERLATALAQLPNRIPDIGLSSRDSAYVIYTSGSTGKPKGIVIPHHAVIDHHFAMIAATGIDREDVTLSVASVSFDPSVQDFFLPLFIGGKVVIASSEEKVDGLLLKERIQQSGIRFMQATPATWRMLMMSGWEGKADMKLMSMGEALTKELSQQLLARGKELWNAYGPSETTIYTTVKQIKLTPLTAPSITGYETLGHPLRNAQVYILDPLQQPVPIGVVGEIYVGGVGLAPGGYLKRPALNQQKFIPNPFRPGQKLYRSGDLGRFLEDGDVEFMGRVDFQVKVRGFRIELGEIESILSQYPGIAENVVVVREDQIDNKRIVAYLIMDAHRNLEVNAIKRYLKGKLPEYMIPSAFVEMQQFPLTSSLKVDRKKLPVPDYNRDDLEIGFLAPRTTSEKSLAKMWSKLLGIKELGINDNFFELGGHSLIAVNMMAKIEQQFDRKLPLSILLKNATIKRLAYLLDQKEETFEFNSLVPIKSTGSKVPIYLIHGAGLHVLMFQTLATHMDEEQPIYALQARGLNGEAAPLDRIESIAAHYITEILQQNPDGPYALAGYSFGGLIAFEMAKQLEEMGKEVVLLGMFDTVVRTHLSGEKKEQSYYRQLADLGKKMAWNLSLITKDPIPNLRYKSHVLKRKLKRWKWSFTHNEQAVLPDQATDHKALVDRMNQIAFENYKIQPWNREIHLFRAQEQRFFLEDFEFLGWKPFALGGVITHEVPGDHLTLFDAPHGVHFAKVLQECLDQTMEKRKNCRLYKNGQSIGKLGQS
ncbi:MAG: amino acid adenylation domain-containing protein, partial [Bacteroidota bacterium]